jgi:hypothetical protein
MSPNRSYIILIALFVFTSCGQNTATSTSSTATPFTSAIGSISNGVAAAGGGLVTSSFALTAMKTESQAQAEIEALVTPMVSGHCDDHGSPIEMGGASISQSDTRFPFVHTYCAMTVNDGDTVRGGFDLVKGLICSLEKGGIAFAGASQSISINFLDTTCWPNGGPGGTGGPSTGIITATGTAPASFNAHFEKGVAFTFVDGSDTLTYKVAANITSTNIEFIAHESWSTGNTGVMAGALNKSTGIMQYEKRDERIRASCSTSSCGWNRHTRISAVLTMSGGEPAGLTSLSYGYSDADVADPTDGAAATSNGKLVTASGSLTGGIKARIFQLSNKTVAQIKTPGEWTETVNTGCMTGAAGINDSANCTSNNGISAFATTTKFALIASTAQLSPSAWLAAFTGFNFTSVDTEVDQAF